MPTDDAQEQEDESDDDNGSSASRDAGARDAGTDAAARTDARASEPSDEEQEDEEQEDEEQPSAIDGGRDAARPAGDAGGRSDAGRTPDAGRDSGGSASARDAGATNSCDELTYESFGEEFVSTYCVECHGADSLFGALNTLQRIQMVKEDADSRVRSMIMPPPIIAAQPMPEERTQFLEWLDCGPN